MTRNDSSLDRKYFAAGTLVFEQGEEGHCAYLIESGLIEVSDARTGAVLGVLGEGELLGEVALLDQHPRTASARAAADSVLVCIERSLVVELLQKADPVVRHLLRVVLSRFRSNLMLPTDRLARHAALAEGAEVKSAATRQLALLKDISHALLAGQFELFYQPIYRLATSALAGFEALIRWHHPTLGMVPPLDFLGLAEQSGQIRKIGLWTVEQACRDWPRLRALLPEPGFVSVNVSATQLVDPDFSDAVLSMQKTAGVDPQDVKFELTETTLIEQPEMALALLTKIREAGSSLALDDFGTGYSGLDHVQRYPISTIKLDRAFVSKVLESEVTRRLVVGTLNLARELEFDVVAEGIENEETAEFLRQQGCQFGQGYLFSKPRALPDLLASYPVRADSR